MGSCYVDSRSSNLTVRPLYSASNVTVNAWVTQRDRIFRITTHNTQMDVSHHRTFKDNVGTVTGGLMTADDEHKAADAAKAGS